MRVLIFGGTRFFGRRLAQRLLEEGHSLTLVTRGQAQDGSCGQVERIRADRRDHGALAQALRGREYDLVYDQICYTPRDAKGALDALGDRAGRYILTSSMAVYPFQDADLEEGGFQPEDYPYDLDATDYDYAEGKRQAEAYLFRHAPFPLAAARVTMVISGTDDYTGRFDFHVARVARGETIGVAPQEQEITFITARDAADFLRFLGTSSFTGPINCGNDGYLSAQGLSRAIGDRLGKIPRFAVAAPEDPRRSPYVLGGSLRVSSGTARKIGYAFPALLPQLGEMAAAAASRLHL